MIKKYLTQALIGAGALVCFSFPQLASASTAVGCDPSPPASNIFACSAALDVNVKLLNAINLGVVTGGAVRTTPGTTTTTLASANGGVGFPLLGGLALTTGLFTDTATSNYTGTIGTLSTTATSAVNGLNLGLSTLFVQLLGVTANTLGSTSSASGTTGTIVTSGSSYITGLSINASGIALANLNITAATPANYDILGANGLGIADLNIFANYQTPILLNGEKIGIDTSALAIVLNGYSFAGNALSGTILIGESAAAVPEPATWAMMLFGFGLVGLVARRRQVPALARA